MKALLQSLATSPLSPPRMAVVLPYLAVALTALVTGLHHRRLRARLGDPAGIWLFFALFFLLLAAVPAAILSVGGPPAGRALAEVGLRAGRWPLALPAAAAALPLALLIGRLASNSPAMRRHYPLSRGACAGDGRFALHEALYVLLYYTSWEMLYRGLLFFPLVPLVGFTAAASLSTALSVLHHIGNPDTEVVGALVGGYLLCALALWSGSFLYCIPLHAAVGVGNDLFIYLRHHRGRRGRS